MHRLCCHPPRLLGSLIAISLGYLSALCVICLLLHREPTRLASVRPVPQSADASVLMQTPVVVQSPARHIILQAEGIAWGLNGKKWLRLGTLAWIFLSVTS